MKSRKFSCITAMTLFAGLATSIRIDAQEPKGPHAEHHRYKFVDVVTFGGPVNYLENDFTGGAGGVSGILFLVGARSCFTIFGADRERNGLVTEVTAQPLCLKNEKPPKYQAA